MIGAGLLAKKAVELGLRAPALGQDLARARARASSATTTSAPGLQPYLDELGFNTVGYGCTTCIGNSGPLPRRGRRGARRAATSSPAPCSRATATSRPASTRRSRRTTSPRRRSSSPTPSPAGSTSTSSSDPLGQTPTGEEVYLADLWPSSAEIEETIAASVRGGDVRARPTATSSAATTTWRALPAPEGALYAWEPRLDLHPPAALPRADAARAGRGRRHRRRALPGLARRLGDDRPHLAGRVDPGRLAGRRATCSSTASTRATSTPTARGAATTR